MGATKTVISNMALRHLKIGKEIGNLDTERSPEAEACRVFYDTVRQDTLRSFGWGFSLKSVALPLITQFPNNEWGYSYRMPSDCVRFQRILSGMRNDSRQTRTPYAIGADDSGQIIYTDAQQAVGEYVFLNLIESSYPPDFILAFSANLAFYVAPSLMGGDPFKLGDRAYKLFEMSLSKAQANSANEDQPDDLPQSEFITGRE